MDRHMVYYGCVFGKAFRRKNFYFDKGLMRIDS